MAKITDADGASKEVADNSDMREPCDELGVMFGCNNGLCHSCRIEILDGQENLSEPSEQEIHGGLDRGPDRLACQCKIKKGEVVYRY